MWFLVSVLGLVIFAAGCQERPVSLPEGRQAVAAPLVPAPRPPDLAGHRTAYDFLANRVHAYAHHNGRLAVPTGGQEFLKIVDGGWKSSWILGEKDGGRPVAYVSGLSGFFYLPVDSDGDGVGTSPWAGATLRVTLRSIAPRQRLTVFANEKAVVSLDVADDWASYDVPIPPAALVPGENRFRLTFRAAGPVARGKRSAAAIARIELGPPDSPPAPELGGVKAVDLAGSSQRAFAFAGPSRLSFYVQVPPKARLVAAYGATEAKGTALVRIARDGARPVTIFEGPIASRWQEHAWDLSPYAGEMVRVDFVSRGGAVAWAAPRIMVRSPAPPPVATRRFSHILVWMVDTLRADKVRIYNPKTVVETPSYDAFAQDATRFEWAHVPGTWSLPSHASILTGVYPSVHGATAHEARLSREVPFLAERLKKAGYRTALFSSNGYVSGKWGFDRGWDINRNFIRESLPNGADYLWKTAKEWVFAPAQKDKPLFAYLATVEPHVIYNPKKEFLARYWTKPYSGPIKPVMTGIQLGQIKSGRLKINDTDKAYLEALHNAEITQSDTAFGVFLADLKAAGLYDQAAIVVVSDHGDEFWEHGDVGHAQSVHQELVRVPLIIRAPGVFPAGRVVGADVEAMDLFPTLLELAGVEVPPGTQGHSLIPLAHDEVVHSPRVALSQNVGTTRGIKAGRYRLIHAGVARMELYDEIRDPREQENLVDKRPIALRSLRSVFGLLVAFENRWDKRSWGTAANLSEAFYVESGGDAGTGGSSP